MSVDNESDTSCFDIRLWITAAIILALIYVWKNQGTLLPKIFGSFSAFCSSNKDEQNWEREKAEPFFSTKNEKTDKTNNEKNDKNSTTSAASRHTGAKQSRFTDRSGNAAQTSGFDNTSLESGQHRGGYSHLNADKSGLKYAASLS